MTASARAAIVTAALVVALATPGPSRAIAPAPSDPSEQLRQHNVRLEHLVDLASGKDFYLVLDARRGLLRLMYEGVPLWDLAVSEMSLGHRRVLFVERDLPDTWYEGVWDDGRLEPARTIERRTLVPPESPAVEDESGTPKVEQVAIPPTPEEAVPAPDRYWIRFAEGRSIEILGDTVATTQSNLLTRAAVALRARLSDAGQSLGLTGGDTVRLRLVLKSDDARALYRSVPEPSRFIFQLADP